MIIDSSVFITIFQAEDECDEFIDIIAKASERAMSAVTFVETAIVLERRLGPQGFQAFVAFVKEARVETIDVTADIAAEAHLAYRTYGRGQHQANLNFGDVFSYATAKLSGQPLLFKGNDFTFTDIEAVAP